MVCCLGINIWSKNTDLEAEVLINDMTVSKRTHKSFECENKSEISTDPENQQYVKYGYKNVSLKRD